MLVSTINTNGSGEIDLKAIKNRFLEINQHRLQRTQDSLKWKQRNFLNLLPLFFHVNHKQLPGYVSGEAPAGISLYTPYKTSIEAAKSLSNDFVYKEAALAKRDIHSLFIMGSVGTIAQSDQSDFDIWLCYNPTLDANQLTELRVKCDYIEVWAESIGLEVHFFPMDADKFRRGEVHQLSSESSGTTQHHLLLEEFYRTGILLAGRFPVWWLVPPDQEKNYDEFVHHLVNNRVVDPDEVIDFGGLSKVPVEEFFGAGLWQVYKGIDSPYKSVLKILLMETYAGSYPNCELLSQHFKQKVYDGLTDLNALDPYSILIRRLEEYLIKRGEKERLELIRRCFYFKVNVPLSTPAKSKDDWRRDCLKELAAGWGWSSEHIAELDKHDEWKIHRVLQERKVLVEDLTQSYMFLSRFARNNAGLSRISQKDLNALGRKLYAAFEKKPGKIELVNRGVSANIVERKLTLQQSTAKSGAETWLLLNETVNPATNRAEVTPIKRGSSAVELLTWCHFNQLINPSTIIALDTKGGFLKVEEVKNIMDALEQQFAGGRLPDTSIDNLEKSPVAVNTCLFINVGTDPLRGNSRRGSLVAEEDGDILNLPGASANLALTFDLVIVTSWQEILTYRYSGVDGLLDCLCQLLRWNLNNKKEQRNKIAAYNFSFAQGAQLVRRIQQLVTDVLNAYFHNNTLNDVRYILEAQQSYFDINHEGDNFYYVRADTEREFFNKLSEPKAGINRFVVDQQAFKGTIAAEVFARNTPGKIQLFYEVAGQLASIYVLDEQGAAFYQKLPFHEDLALINQYMAFFDTVLNRQAMAHNNKYYAGMLENIEFYRVKRLPDGKCDFIRQESSYEKNKRAYFHVQVVGSVIDQKTVFTMYTEDKEYSSLDYGINLFREVAKYVLRRRPSGERYPIYITDLDLAPALLGERASSQFQIIEYLNFKKRIEEKLNYELEHC
ncbi:MAG: class I adenylate cyclase [Gammaproteobacteria bacterium]|nr:class I adenylate cyclase [Gammaproteobacteria bacterium]